MIPEEFKTFGTAIARLKVAFKDAEDADVDKMAKDMGTAGMISSPTSDWFKSGCPDVEDDSAEMKVCCMQYYGTLRLILFRD